MEYVASQSVCICPAARMLYRLTAKSHDELSIYGSMPIALSKTKN